MIETPAMQVVFFFLAFVFAGFVNQREPGDICCIIDRIMAGFFFFYFSCYVFRLIFVCFHLFFVYNCYYAVHGPTYYISSMILEAVTTEKKPINYFRLLLPLV